MANLTSGHSGHAASSPSMASALLPTLIIMHPALCAVTMIRLVLVMIMMVMDDEDCDKESEGRGL